MPLETQLQAYARLLSIKAGGLCYHGGESKGIGGGNYLSYRIGLIALKRESVFLIE